MKLSDQLFDAVLTGDKLAQDRIRAEINALSASRSHTYDQQGFSPDYVKTLESDDTTPMHVAKWMSQTYGKDWNTWENETIRQRLFADFGMDPSAVISDRIFAIKAAMNSTQPLEDWYAFNQVCLALCGSGADFLVLSSPTPAMAVFGLEFCRTYHGDIEVDEEVLKYICTMLIADGIYVPPPSLYDDLNVVMKWMTSVEIQGYWHDIYLKYNEIAANPEADHGEDIVAIQARRIHDAETAALHYAGA